jgi:hypothetical protein
MGWDCRFFIKECVRGKIGNDMCVWEWSNQRRCIFVPFIIGEGDDRDIIGVSRGS